MKIKKGKNSFPFPYRNLSQGTTNGVYDRASLYPQNFFYNWYSLILLTYYCTLPTYPQDNSQKRDGHVVITAVHQPYQGLSRFTYKTERYFLCNSFVALLFRPKSAYQDNSFIKILLFILFLSFTLSGFRTCFSV